MTGYTVHTGSTEKFAAGWEQIFGSAEAERPARRKKSAAGKRRAGRGAPAATKAGKKTRRKR